MTVADIATHQPQERTCIATYITNGNPLQFALDGAVGHIQMCTKQHDMQIQFTGTTTLQQPTTHDWTTTGIQCVPDSTYQLSLSRDVNKFLSCVNISTVSFVSDSN